MELKNMETLPWPSFIYNNSLSDLCLGVEKKIFKEMMDLPVYGQALTQELFLGNHYFILSLSDLCLE